MSPEKHGSPERRSCTFDELTVGQVFRSKGRTLTESDLDVFCALTGDRRGIHADEDDARARGLKGRVFHGTFGIALAVSMTADLLPLENPVIAALGIREWVFKAPLYIADTVRAELKIVDKRVTSDRRRAVIGRRLRLINQDGVVIQEGLADLMVGLESTRSASAG